jgi:hypothetical protein
MPDNPRRAKGGGWAVLALGLLVVALYVLSVGPWYWLAMHGYIPLGSDQMYLPLWRAAQSWPPADAVLQSYLGWWVPVVPCTF